MAIVLDGTTNTVTPLNGALGATTPSTVVATTVTAATTMGVGNATPSTSGAGITFPATQSASTDANTLDDYEEGTWTPTITGDGGGGAATYSVRTGTYTKVGNQINAYFRIILTARGTPSGAAVLSGLPFTVKNVTGASGGSISNWVNLGVNTYSVTIYPVEGQNFAYFYIQDALDGSQANATVSLIAATTILIGMYTYTTD